MPVTRRSQQASLRAEQTHTQTSDEKQQASMQAAGADEEEEEEASEAAEEAAAEEQRLSGGGRRYGQQRPSRRLSRVDDVLHRLKRQRERKESREWLGERKEQQQGDDEADEEWSGERKAGAEDEEQAGPELYEAPEEEAAEGGEEEEEEGSVVVSTVSRKRRRYPFSRRSGPLRRSHISAADEYDDGSGFVVYSDEEETDERAAGGAGGAGGEGGSDEAEAELSDAEAAGDERIEHMRLHNQLQAGSDDDDGDVTAAADSGEQRGAAHTASSPLAALFSHSSRAAFGPVQSLDVAFHYWAQYLASVLLDEQASATVLASASARWLVDKAVKVVEEQFESRLTNWVTSALWLQTPRERFYQAVTQLPYITSRRLNAYDAAADGMDEAQHIDVEALGSGSVCDTCRGQHQATHYVEIFGVPYDFQQLAHPFDTDKIFQCRNASAHNRHSIQQPSTVLTDIVVSCCVACCVACCGVRPLSLFSSLCDV